MIHVIHKIAKSRFCENPDFRLYLTPLSESLACILVTNRDSLPRDVAALVALIDEFSDPLRFDITEFRLFREARKISPIFEHIIEHFCSELFRFSKSDTNLMVIQRNFPIQSNR